MEEAILMKTMFNKVKFVNKTRDYFFKKNEEQLQRERISLEYDYIRSLAR